MSFDPHAIRAEFPILSRQVNGHSLVYLDSAASAQKPKAVISAMTQAMEHSYSNVHRGLHTLANETTDAYEAARETVRGFLNAASSDEIIFTKGTTDAVNLVASSYGADWGRNDEIIVTEGEHHANIVPWHFLRERQGVTLTFAPLRDDGALDMAAFSKLLSDRTRIVAIGHMSNVTGVVHPIAEIARLTHAAGAALFVDGAQGAVHTRADVRALNADFYAFSAHKLYGPTGAGALYGRRELLEDMRPYQGGGEMIGVVEQDRITYGDLPHRFEAGTPPILEIIGMAAAIEWLNGLDRTAIEKHEHAMLARVTERLNGANWLTQIGTAPGKGAIFTFNVEGAHAHDIAQILDKQGVAVRAGAHCAEPLMARFGVTASARASFALYNTLEEADAFVDALTKARTFFT